MSSFRVGQKVALKRQFGRASLLRATADGVVIPVIGPVYTIRGFDDQREDGGTLALWLDEIANPPHWINGIEPSFCASLFEAVTDRKTDISVFKAMLNPSRVEEVA